MKWVNALAKLFYCLIMALILVVMKKRLGLHNHFFLGLAIMLVLVAITKLALKGVEKLGK